MTAILVYVDKGVGPQSVKFLIKTLRSEGKRYHIKKVNPSILKEESWKKEAALLIFPGGRDIYYHEALQGTANQNIRAYVENGGKFLGLCAGGYYGSSFIEFEKGYPLEVIGKRELAFFPGLARGPAYGPGQFSYENEEGSRHAQLTWTGKENLGMCTAYFNGGCEFVDANRHPNIDVLAYYRDIAQQPAAVIQCTVGKGRAILSGIHPEYPLQKEEESRKRIFNIILNRLLS